MPSIGTVIPCLFGGTDGWRDDDLRSVSQGSAAMAVHEAALGGLGGQGLVVSPPLNPDHAAEANLRRWLRLFGAGGGGAPGTCPAGGGLLRGVLPPTTGLEDAGLGMRMSKKDFGLELVAEFGSLRRLQEATVE